jgi:hypothetical protein
VADEPVSGLRRWSRLKQEQDRRAPRSARRGTALRAAAPVAPPAGTAAATAPIPPAEEGLAVLPDPATLTAASDFTAFLRAGVPEELHRQALRRLWSSDPIFGFRDGLTDYADDMRGTGIVKQAVRTAYRVGRGFLEEEQPRPSANVPEDAEAASATGSGTATASRSADGDAEPGKDTVEDSAKGSDGSSAKVEDVT